MDSSGEYSITSPNLLIMLPACLPQFLYQRPELGHVTDGIGSTPEIAASSPRYRRKSSTFIDGVHDLSDGKQAIMAPAQLYSTMSGRLFHSGRIAIVLVGPPARGRTYVSHRPHVMIEDSGD
jgi:hypothetical protein